MLVVNIEANDWHMIIVCYFCMSVSCLTKIKWTAEKNSKSRDQVFMGSKLTGIEWENI